MATDTPKKPGNEKDTAPQGAPSSPPAQADKAPAPPTPAAGRGSEPPKGAEGPSKVVSFETAKQAAKPAQEAPAQGKPPAAKRGRPAKAQPQQDTRTAPAKTPAKKQPAAVKDGAKQPKQAAPTTGKDKAAIESELREKFGIPKSEKAVAAWVPPETETVEKLGHKQLRPFNDHPFNVDTSDPKFKALTVSIRTHGITQPIIARPIPGARGKNGALEIVSGHRRQAAALAAGLDKVPVIIRALNNDQAIQQMVEDNVNNREIGTMELARALKMQLESIKHQGARAALDGGELTSADSVGKRSNEIIAERNSMSVKQVQRHIALTNLAPTLQEYVDGKPIKGDKLLKIGFTPAFELSYLSPKNQEYVVSAIEAQQSTPSQAQAKRMRELDKSGTLNMDVIDGIMTEEKKEVNNVIISGAELESYFGKDKTPAQMKEKIIELLDKEFKPQEREAGKPEKKVEQEK